MYAVSETWARANESFLAPEGLIEISCHIPELEDALVYTKSDLLSFTHSQTGSLVSGELPKNHIEFSLDNSDDKWNPHNPGGMTKYLTERLKVTLRYGFLIDGVEEWIPGGVFYLSEWKTPQNGIEATFVARDILEFLIDQPYDATIEGTLYEIVENVLLEAGIPADGSVGGVSISDELKKYSVGDIGFDVDATMAVVVQKCANAAGCIMYQDRDGVFRIEKRAYENAKYTIPKNLSFAHPEIELFRPIKSVAVTYIDNTMSAFQFADSGEIQRVANNYISDSTQAYSVARWVRDALLARRKIKGEFRGDPRFDLFDLINVESKYGTMTTIELTSVRVTFAGAFRIFYEGYARTDSVRMVARCGEIYAGEVV